MASQSGPDEREKERVDSLYLCLCLVTGKVRSKTLRRCVLISLRIYRESFPSRSVRETSASCVCWWLVGELEEVPVKVGTKIKWHWSTTCITRHQSCFAPQKSTESNGGCSSVLTYYSFCGTPYPTTAQPSIQFRVLSITLDYQRVLKFLYCSLS
jgi:hypothetical protein